MMAVLTICLASCLGDDDDSNTPSYNVTFENVNFEKAALPTGGDNPGVMIGKTYESENGYVFQNYYTDEGGYAYNSGYTVSNNNDIKTPGAENQYSVFSASNNTKNQFLIYNPPYGSKAYIERKDGQAFYPYTVYIAPTTYTMQSIFNGDAYAKKFEEKDTFAVKIQGCDAYGEPIKGSVVSFNLVKNLSLLQYNAYSGHYLQKFVYVNGTSNLWTMIPLYMLGKVNKILITFDSSDKGEWGINTPQYLALDEFTTITQETVPEYEKYLASQNNK